MSDKATLSISFDNSTDSQETCVKIEQEPWGKDVGETTQSQAIEAIAALMYGGSWPVTNCGGFEGRFQATVYVYPCEYGLNYRLGVSHGFVSGRLIEVPIREETIQCSMELEHELDYPVWAILSKSWLGKCYDTDGNITTKPNVTVVDGKLIVLDKQVYGTIRVRYSVFRHVYYITVYKRQEALENTYQSVAYAIWDGGVVWIDVKAPTGFEDTDGECENGAWYDEDGSMTHISGMDVCDEDEYSVPVSVNANKHVEVDYCSQVEGDPVINESVDWETRTEEDCS